VRRRILVVGALVAATIVTTGCGSEGSGVSAAASRRLHAEVDALRAAATTGDRAATYAEIARVEESVRALRADGGLSDEAAARVDAALAAVRDRTSLLPAPTTTTTTTTTRPERPADEPEKPQKPDKGPARGKGKGHAED